MNLCSFIIRIKWRQSLIFRFLFEFFMNLRFVDWSSSEAWITQVTFEDCFLNRFLPQVHGHCVAYKVVRLTTESTWLNRLTTSCSEPYLVSIFVVAYHQTGLNTRSMTRRSIIVKIRGREGRARAEARALLGHAGHRPT